MRRRGRVAAPLWVLAAVGALALGLLVIGGMVGGLALASALDRRTLSWGVGLGAAAVGVVTVAAAIAADRTAQVLRTLRDAAVSRLNDPAAPALPPASSGLRSTAELADLAAALDALALRVRVADELAARLRRSSDQAGAGLFDLLSGLIAAEEGARGQLSAELHDTVAQSLAVARTLLADHQPERALERVEDAEDQVRAVMARTRPPALRDGDLAAAVENTCADLDRRYALRVDLHWPIESRPLPLAIAVTAYRFFQEALLNVVKHADTDTAEAGLEFRAGELVGWVADRGAGFDPAAVRPDRGRHVGLGLLRDRLRLAGGGLEVEAAPGAGSRLTLRLPLAPAPTGEPEPGPALPVEPSVLEPTGQLSAAPPRAVASPRPAVLPAG